MNAHTSTPKVTTNTGTWLGRSGTNTTYRLAGPTGLRVISKVWADAPEVAEVRLVCGDGRRDDFQVLREAQVPAAQADATAREWLD